MTHAPLYCDFTGHRLGDKAVAAWMLGAWALRENRGMSIYDPTANDFDSFSVRDFFTELAAIEVPHAPDHEVRGTGNLWIHARKLFYELGGPHPPRMTPTMELPEYPVAMHILHDAPYNKVRNWDREQGILTSERMRDELGVSPWVVPARGSADQICARDILNKIAAAKMFIGGDSGFSHAYALMRPDRPIVWIGHDMSGDKAGFGQDFDSSPISWNVTHFHLQQNQIDVPAVLAAVRKLL